MRNLNNKKAFRHQGITIDNKGIKELFRRKYSILWQDVISIITMVSDGSHGLSYSTVIESASHKRVFLNKLKAFGGFSSVKKYSAVLEFMAGKVYSEVMSEKTEFIIKWVKELNNIKKIQKLVKQNPGDIEHLKKLGNIYHVRLDLKKAKKIFNRALLIAPNNADILYSIFLIDRDCDVDYRKLIKQYEKMVLLEPNNVKYVQGLASIYLGTDDPRGEDCARRAIALDPSDIKMKNELAWYFFRKKRFSEAKNILWDLEKITANTCLYRPIKETIEYVDKYERDKNFRKKEKTKQTIYNIKMWAMIIAPFLFLILYAAFAVLKSMGIINWG